MSCRDIVAGDAVDVGKLLCDHLASCYGEAFDCEDLTAEIGTMTASQRKAFLSEAESCTATCPAALTCLNEPPLCETGGCSEANPCCDALDGVAECVGGTCCATRGAPCDGEGALACCEAGSCSGGVCGGRPCSFPGEACALPSDCCTGLCENQVCLEKLCVKLDEPCADQKDCCRPEVQGLPPDTEIVCDQVCFAVLEVCVADEFGPCDPTDGVLCCPGLQCRPGDTGLSCQTPTCVGVGDFCDVGAECCDGVMCDQGICGFVCGDTGAFCSDHGACCSELCSFGTCVPPSCVSGEPCHSPCEEGTALDPTSCNDDPPVDQCVSDVIILDPYCNCVSWDMLCVQQAQQECGGLCPIPF